MRNDCRFEKDFDQKKYCSIAAAVVGSAVVGGVMQSNAASDAADSASGATRDATNAQIGESRRQFDAIRKLLEPYTKVGPTALTAQQDLIGLNGTVAQNKAIKGLSDSPYMSAMAQQGENAILQNASATGGLRGGNTQAALAQFRPQLLNQIIEQQYAKLNGLTTLGQNSAAGVGAAGQNSSNQIIAALGQQGAAEAGNALAQGKAQSGLISNLTNAAGMAFGSNLFGMGSPSVIAPSTGFAASGGGGFLGSGQFLGSGLMI